MEHLNALLVIIDMCRFLAHCLTPLKCTEEIKFEMSQALICILFIASHNFPLLKLFLMFSFLQISVSENCYIIQV